MKISIRPFLSPLLPAPDGGQLCLPIVGLERNDVVLKDPYGRVLQTFSHHGKPWTVNRLLALEDTIALPNTKSADLFLGDQMIGSTDLTMVEDKMPGRHNSSQKKMIP